MKLPIQPSTISIPVTPKLPLMCTLNDLFKDSLTFVDDTSVDLKLQELRVQSSSLTSKTACFSSVLYRYRDISRLQENAVKFLDEIIEEMIKR